MKRKFTGCLAGIMLLLLLTACAGKNPSADTGSSDRKDSSGQEVTLSSEEKTASEETEESAVCEEITRVISVIEETSDQSSFGIDTVAALSLNGKAISGDYHMQSEVHIAQEENHGDMQMAMISSSDIDDIVTYAYYKDGWYYVDGADGKQKEEKTPDQVLELISGVTDLVKESAEKIRTVEVTAEGETTVYHYELPSYLAEDYLEKMIDSLDIDDFSGAQIRVDQAVLETRVDADGLLQQQTVQITGDVHKAIFTVPAEAEITADFRIPDSGAPEIETW